MTLPPLDLELSLSAEVQTEAALRAVDQIDDLSTLRELLKSMIWQDAVRQKIIQQLLKQDI